LARPIRRNPNVSPLVEQFGKARADYDAAKDTRFKRKRLGMISGGSAADYHYRTEQAYFGITEQARELVRNHPLIGQGIRRLVANILSENGFTLDVQTGDTGLDDDLSGRWKEWANEPDECDIQGEQDFNGLAELCLQQTITDGDIITLPTDEGHLQQIENHRLRNPARTTRNVVHGVELDSEDKPRRRLAYWIAHEDVEQYYPVPKASEMTRYAARVDGTRQVFHHYLPDRSSQTRGVTCLAAPMETAGMGDDLMFAQLVKAQMAAAVTMIRELAANAQPPNFGAAGGQDVTQEQRPSGIMRDLAGWQPGMELFGFPGETIRIESANVPNAEFFQHAMLILSIVAVNLDLPVQVLMLDATHTNFSGWRGSIDQARQRWLKIQRWLIRSFHTPVYLWKVRQWAAADASLRARLDRQNWRRRVGTDGVDAFGHIWHPAGWPYIEPTQDATGDLIQIRNLLAAPSYLAARRGFDYGRLRKDCIRDRVLLINDAQDAADEINKRNSDRAGWVPLTWRDIAQPPMPEGIQVSVASGAELGAPPAPPAAPGAPTNGQQPPTRAPARKEAPANA
jgi:lambda family phage portal protein